MSKLIEHNSIKLALRRIHTEHLRGVICARLGHLITKCFFVNKQPFYAV